MDLVHPGLWQALTVAVISTVLAVSYNLFLRRLDVFERRQSEKVQIIQRLRDVEAVLRHFVLKRTLPEAIDLDALEDLILRSSPNIHDPAYSVVVEVKRKVEFIKKNSANEPAAERLTDSATVAECAASMLKRLRGYFDDEVTVRGDGDFARTVADPQIAKKIVGGAAIFGVVTWMNVAMWMSAMKNVPLSISLVFATLTSAAGAGMASFVARRVAVKPYTIAGLIKGELWFQRTGLAVWLLYSFIAIPAIVGLWRAPLSGNAKLLGSAALTLFPLLAMFAVRPLLTRRIRRLKNGLADVRMWEPFSYCARTQVLPRNAKLCLCAHGVCRLRLLGAATLNARTTVDNPHLST